MSSDSTVWTDLEAKYSATAELVEYSHTGLAPDTKRYYRVSAINADATGPPSNVASATTEEAVVAVAPGPPTDLSAKPDGPTTINLEWEPPADTGSSAIETYRIEVSNDSSLWTGLEANYSVTTESIEYSHTGLAPDTKRYYRVYANNADTTGPPSNVASATTEGVAVAPGPPTDLSAKPDGPTTINLEWEPPADTGSSAIVTYYIEQSSDSTVWTELAYPAGTVNEYSHTGLAPDTKRYYRVYANNADTTGPPSNVASATTAGVAVAPGPPTGLSAEPDGPMAIDLEWKPPADTGSSAIRSYYIEQSSDSTVWTALRHVAETVNEYSHIGLAPDTKRYYRVSAINAEAAGLPSNVASATTENTPVAGAPARPTDLSAKPDGPTTINLEWEPPADTGSSAIEAYRIEVSSDSSLWTDLEAKYSATAESVEYSHTGLAPDTKRYYRVSAINTAGTGPRSNVASATTAAGAGAPGKPINARAHAVYDTLISVTWKQPTDTGTSAITGNRIEVSTDGGTIWTDLVANTSNTHEFYFHAGLTPDTTFRQTGRADDDQSRMGTAGGHREQRYYRILARKIER